MQTRTIRVGGMTCVNCENRIEKKLRRLTGIEEALADYAAGTAKVTYDESAIDLSTITCAIESLGYTIQKDNRSETILRVIGVLAIILALSFLLRAFSTSSLAASFPIAEAGMGYGMLFVIGLLTSVHCIAMCGGINLSQSLQQINSLLPGVLYNSGRLVSYTAIGTAVGALGSVITVSDLFRNVVLLIAGLLMVIMGINMLGLFPGLRRITQRLKPKLPPLLSSKIDGQRAGQGPLIIGFLNGFMPCGPLQAMQLYALSTGSPIKGGISMFLFCIGTVPLMFALGAAGGLLSGAKGRAFSRIAMQAGAVLVSAMGVIMLTNGWSGTGLARNVNLAFSSTASVNSSVATQAGSGANEPVIRNGVQIINSTLQPSRYPAITVQQGIPVRWTISAPQGSITGCNRSFIIREYGIQHTFNYGENVIEFIPERTGRFSYACWMNMIRSTITVVAQGESIANAPAPDLTPKPAGVPIPTDEIAMAQVMGNYQAVEIRLTDGGFEPAIVVMQRQLSALWSISIDSILAGSDTLIFPAYYAILQTRQGDNQVQLIPFDDFEFSTGDNAFYGYVKVVDSIDNADIDSIKAEVKNHETLIYPEAYFDNY